MDATVHITGADLLGLVQARAWTPDDNGRHSYYSPPSSRSTLVLDVNADEARKLADHYRRIAGEIASLDLTANILHDIKTACAERARETVANDWPGR